MRALLRRLDEWLIDRVTVWAYDRAMRRGDRLALRMWKDGTLQQRSPRRLHREHGE